MSKKRYTAEVISEFKIGDRTYSVGDKYITYKKFNYNTLLNQKRIK